MPKHWANDLWSKYGSHTSFVGWYLPFEVDNLNEQQQSQWDNLVSFYTTVGNYLHALAPGKKIIIAPFSNANLGSSAETPAQWTTMWEYILSRSPLDILALQDGIGAGHATASQLPTWYQATQTAICTSAPGMKFRSDAETYVVVSGFHPMFISTLVADMNAGSSLRQQLSQFQLQSLHESPAGESCVLQHLFGLPFHAEGRDDASDGANVTSASRVE